MTTKPKKPIPPPFRVTAVYVLSPDADDCLRRALQILMEAAPEAVRQVKEGE